jgi:hypothetical protein
MALPYARVGACERNGVKRGRLPQISPIGCSVGEGVFVRRESVLLWQCWYLLFDSSYVIELAPSSAVSCQLRSATTVSCAK